MKHGSITRTIPINKIIVPEGRFREDFSSVTKLAKSIDDYGLIQTLAVKDLGDGTYELLAGETRLRAIKQLGETEVPARVYPINISPAEMKAIEFEENYRRSALTWQEEVKAKRELHNFKQTAYGAKLPGPNSGDGWGLQDTAELLNEKPQTTTEDIKLAKAIESLPELAEMTNKSDAIKKMRQMLRTFERDETLESIRAVEASTPQQVLQRKIADSYIISDVHEGLAKIPSESVDLIELDPPFGIELDRLKQVKGGADSINLDDYNESDPRQYRDFVWKLSMESYRIAKPNAWLIFWFGSHPWFEVVYQAIVQNGWACRRIPGVWIIPSGQTNQPQMYLANQWQPFFYARKGNAEIQKPGHSNVFITPPVPSGQKVHPTEKPVPLYEDIISTFVKPGSEIVTPFAGSGNTILAAANYGCSCKGFDLSEEYKKGFELKVFSNVPPNY